MTTSTVQATVTAAGDLATALRAALAFADDPEDGVPGLGAVFLETDEGTLTVTATDRRRLGQARVTTSGSLPHAALIPAPRAAWLADALDELLVSDPVILTIIVSHLSPPRLRVQHPQLAVELAVEETWIDYRKIFAAMDAEPGTVLSSPILLQPAVLSPLAVLADLYSLPTRWTFFGPLKPVRVEVGGAMVAAFMPTRHDAAADRLWPQANDQR